MIIKIFWVLFISYGKFDDEESEIVASRILDLPLRPQDQNFSIQNLIFKKNTFESNILKRKQISSNSNFVFDSSKNLLSSNNHKKYIHQDKHIQSDLSFV